IGVNVALSRRFLNDLAGANQAFEESLRLFSEVGDPGGVAYTLYLQASHAAEEGDFSRAVTLHEQGLRVGRETGDKNLISNHLIHLGRALWHLGQFEQAIAALRECQDLISETGSSRMWVYLAEILARLLATTAASELAVRLF